PATLILQKSTKFLPYKIDILLVMILVLVVSRFILIKIVKVNIVSAIYSNLIGLIWIGFVWYGLNSYGGTFALNFHSTPLTLPLGSIVGSMIESSSIALNSSSY